MIYQVLRLCGITILSVYISIIADFSLQIYTNALDFIFHFSFRFCAHTTISCFIFLPLPVSLFSFLPFFFFFSPFTSISLCSLLFPSVLLAFSLFSYLHSISLPSPIYPFTFLSLSFPFCSLYLPSFPFIVSAFSSPISSSLHSLLSRPLLFLPYLLLSYHPLSSFFL